MEVEFLETEDGLVNTRFVVLLHRTDIEGFKGSWKVEYQFGGEVRSTTAAANSVEQLLGGLRTPC